MLFLYIQLFIYYQQIQIFYLYHKNLKFQVVFNFFSKLDFLISILPSTSQNCLFLYQFSLTDLHNISFCHFQFKVIFQNFVFVCKALYFLMQLYHFQNLFFNFTKSTILFIILRLCNFLFFMTFKFTFFLFFLLNKIFHLHIFFTSMFYHILLNHSFLSNLNIVFNSLPIVIVFSNYANLYFLNLYFITTTYYFYFIYCPFDLLILFLFFQAVLFYYQNFLLNLLLQYLICLILTANYQSILFVYNLILNNCLK